MGTGLALGAAVFFGAGDFMGGLATRRANVVAAVVISQASGTLLLAVVLAWLPAAHPHLLDYGWAAAAGLVGGIGVGFLYVGLATGAMTVVAPITGVLAAAIPVAVGTLLGERPGLSADVGIAVAVAAVVLLSQAGSRPASPARTASAGRSLALAGIAGLAFGVFYVLLAQVGRGAGLSPLLALRGAAAAPFLAAAVIRREPLRLPAPTLALPLVGGILDITGNVLYLLAVHRGLLSLVAVLASLYPASTVLMAAVILRERLRRPQLAGLALAAAAVVLITAP
ncbi:MAG TPA: EamA family transporter [Candidatus Micrarchaeia archaeon]|nr:EamA family transporter [Candidatus Micrarchaeia archaeon]